jgi:hypothetical protein
MTLLSGFENIPQSVQLFVVGAVGLHVAALAVWAVLAFKESRHPKEKSKMF